MGASVPGYTYMTAKVGAKKFGVLAAGHIEKGIQSEEDNAQKNHQHKLPVLNGKFGETHFTSV